MRNFTIRKCWRALKQVIALPVFLLFSLDSSATNHTWMGGISSDWSVAANWSPASVPVAADAVFISNIAYVNQPTVTANVSCLSITFGTSKAITLTVNSGVTLTVMGDITQSHSSGYTGITTNIVGQTVSGVLGGTINCVNFFVGDNTNPPTPVSLTIGLANITNNTIVNLGIKNFNASGNLKLNTTSATATLYVLFIPFVSTNVNNPILNLNDGNLSVTSTVQTANSNYKSTPGFTILGIGLFPSAINSSQLLVNPAGNASGTSPTLYLGDSAALSIAATGSFVDFNNGGAGTSTVYYNGPAQVVYTNSTTNLDNSPQTYQNLLLTGTGTKTTNAGSLLVGSNLTSSTATVLLNTNNTVVTVGNNWVNSSNVAQGSGDITIGGSVTNNLGGTLGLGSGNFLIAGNYTNNVGGVYSQGTGTTYFNGAGAQALVDNSTTGTIFKIVNFSGGGTATMSAGTNNINFAIATKGTLTMSNNSNLIAGTTASAGGASYLTLKSGSAGSATVTPITGTSTITGNVSVQRFMTGGTTKDAVTGRWSYRNYRLMSSAVNAGLVSGAYPYTLNYLAASSIVTGATSTLGTVGGNPTIYVYSEDYTPDNTTFTSGNFQGVTDISKVTSPYTLAITNNGTGKAIYVGNGFMFFFRGDNIHSVGTSPGKTTYPFVAPDSVIFTANGFLNQGSYSVKHWTNYAGLLYTTVTTPSPGNGTVKGFNLVGNPYASSIDFSTFSNSSTSAPIYGKNVNPQVWELDPVSNLYGTYNSNTGVALNNGNKIIVSGQGFFVQSNNSGSTLTFNETAKSNTQLSGSFLLMGKPLASNSYDQDLRFTLSRDSSAGSEILIGFNSAATTAYDPSVDDMYLPSPGANQSIWETTPANVNLVAKWLPLPKGKDKAMVNIAVTALQSGNFKLSRTELKAVPELYDIWLIDRFKNDSLDMRHNAVYAFNIDKGDTNTYGAHRFQVIVRQNPSLGVHLLNFTASKVTTGSQLSWKTENEENFTNFTMERSTDGISFDVLGGFRSAAEGSYSFIDKNPANGINNYRLKIEDLNGVVNYSDVVALNYTNSGNSIASSGITVYPSPVAASINLSISQPATNPAKLQTIGTAGNTSSNQQYDIKIININGTVVKTAVSSSAEWKTNVGSLLPGTYVVQVLKNNDKSLVGKTTFVKL